MSTIDYHPHYVIGSFLGQPLHLTRYAFNYLGHNVNSSHLIWRHDKHSNPAIINIRHCLNSYFMFLTDCRGKDFPKINRWETVAWVETGVNYELQAHLFSEYLKLKVDDEESNWDFESWCQCALAEFVIDHYPELLTPEEKYAVANARKIRNLNVVELTALEPSEICQVNLFTLVR